MKPLIIFLLLAGMAWGGNDIDWTKFKDGNFVCAGPNGYVPCSMTKKGHCPHCGAQGIESLSFIFQGDKCIEQQLPTGKEKTGWITCKFVEDDAMTCEDSLIDVCGYKVYRCPNGHVFWEKE